MTLPPMRPTLVAAALLLTLVLAASLARGGTPPELSDLTAGSLPTAAPSVSVVPMALTTDSVVSPAPRWVRRTSAASGIPRPAMRSYGRAELVLAREQPSCHLGWTTLAGIGWVESEQGTIGGRTLGSDGVPSTPVVGPVLADGDHALGPMQFIASTWARWGADGDGDGRADVDDLDDAALAAARYLCADDHDLATGAAWGAAVFSYNHDNAYVSAVYDAARTYGERTG